MKILLLGLICSLVSSCGGTGSPNPPSSRFNCTTSECGGQIATDTLITELCIKLFTCNGNTLPVYKCSAGLYLVDNVDEEIGIETGVYSHLEDIAFAEIQKEIIPDLNAVTNCLVDIDSLACSDPRVLGAWAEDDPDNFDNVAAMIPQNSGSCPSIFTN